ncbi:MAG: GNAT family N-acetyltransferase [Acidobacteriota bacterium]|nr:GNAT family N-acetyltransferase [Acidobacteriota bacterium]
MSFAWDEMPRISGERVRLRPLVETDVPALYAVFSDPDVMRYWSSPPLESVAAARALLDDIHAHFARKTLFQWGIVRADDDLVIGTTTIFQIDPDHRRAEIGFALGREHRGRGYASDAVTSLIRFAFDTLDLHRLEADPDPQNAASIAVLKKQGFKREGFLRERYFLSGKPQDAEYYGLLRREWTKGR